MAHLTLPSQAPGNDLMMRHCAHTADVWVHPWRSVLCTRVVRFQVDGLRLHLAEDVLRGYPT